jgi:hypothetical protein
MGNIQLNIASVIRRIEEEMGKEGKIEEKTKIQGRLFS